MHEHFEIRHVTLQVVREAFCNRCAPLPSDEMHRVGQTCQAFAEARRWRSIAIVRSGRPIRSMPASFLYADGDALLAHGHRRMQITGRAESPGPWTRQRLCPTADAAPEHGGGASIAQAGQTVVWVAGVPLTQDAWQPLADGELVAVRAGALLARRLATAA